MGVILDSKDVATLDKQFASLSQVWDPLSMGAKSITAADFIGANEVRVNKMSGFVQAAYKRNADNARTAVNVDKETIKLKHEDWFGYDVDALDESESAALTVQNIQEEHRRLITVPQRDKVAVQTMFDAATTKVADTITADNVLDMYDDAEAFMLDHGVSDNFILFVSSKTRKLLKNASKVSRSFTTNEQGFNGINRKVDQLDGSVPILPVSADRLAGLGIEDDVNFILVPMTAVAPIVKYSSVDLIPASQDPNGYRDKLKGLDHYDAIVFDNAKDSIYVGASPKA